MDANNTTSSDTSDTTSSSVVSWISWFCSLPGHDWLVQVPEAWIEDEFNCQSLSSQVALYQNALDMILDLEDENIMDLDEMSASARLSLLESSAITLYCLIHQRFITTRSGLLYFKSKYEHGDFGTCPRVGCFDTKTIPCGLSDQPLISSIKSYCPSCHDVYTPKQSKYHSTDGCCFGTSFHLLLFMMYPSLTNLHIDYSEYLPKIYGFKISKFAKIGGKAKWLRKRNIEN